MSQGSSQPPPLKLETWQKQQLEERIRELEEQLDQEVRLYARCRERIAKAREILTEELKHASGGYFPGFIQGVIDALEGK